MKAFWWFKENKIAGMGRPGFNAVHWFDLPFDEAMVLGWIGQHSGGTYDLADFHKHLSYYAPRCYKYYGYDEAVGNKQIEAFNSTDGFNAVLKRMNERTGFLQDFELGEGSLNFNLNSKRLEEEIKFLQAKNVKRIVTLTEQHHHKDFLQNHFELHHFSIADLGAPKVEQVRELAGVISYAQSKNEIIAVHCLAGIGRTSTMLLGAHVLLGENPAELALRIKERNPTFEFTGPQGEFLRSLAAFK